MCQRYQVRSVFFTYARLYAFSRMLMSPSTPRCIAKASAVVVIGVDRHGVGSDKSLNSALPRNPKAKYSPSTSDLGSYLAAYRLIRGKPFETSSGSSGFRRETKPEKNERRGTGPPLRHDLGKHKTW
jgi:hypothetical protein